MLIAKIFFMATLYDRLIGEGLNPGEAGTFMKGIKRIGSKYNRSVESQFSIFIENMRQKINMAEYFKSPMSVVDIKDVAKRLNFPEPNEMQLDEIILRYPISQEEDPTGSWNLIVEQLLYDVMDEHYVNSYAISSEEVEKIAKKLNIELNPGMIREVKNLYYQSEEIDKERNKVNILSACIEAVVKYL